MGRGLHWAGWYPVIREPGDGLQRGSGHSVKCQAHPGIQPQQSLADRVGGAGTPALLPTGVFFFNFSIWLCQVLAVALETTLTSFHPAHPLDTLQLVKAPLKVVLGCAFVHTRAQLCPTLCDPMDYSPISSVHGIFQARILEWVAVPSSRGSSQPRD